MKELDELIAESERMQLGYTVSTVRAGNGTPVTRIKFETFQGLERFFTEELIGSEVMAGKSSKVIGTTLLIWERKTV